MHYGKPQNFVLDDYIDLGLSSFQVYKFFPAETALALTREIFVAEHENKNFQEFFAFQALSSVPVKTF